MQNSDILDRLNCKIMLTIVISSESRFGRKSLFKNGCDKDLKRGTLLLFITFTLNFFHLYCTLSSFANCFNISPKSIHQNKQRKKYNLMANNAWQTDFSLASLRRYYQ